MFRVFQRHAAAAVLFEAMMDGLVGFAAVLLAFVTIRMFPLPALVGALANPGVILVASCFALITALLESFVGLYRHASLSPISVIVRLAIVAAIARMHGGEPFAQSGAGGTSIGFVLARQT